MPTRGMIPARIANGQHNGSTLTSQHKCHASLMENVMLTPERPSESTQPSQHKCHASLMENVMLNQKEQARLKVLNSLLAEQMTVAR